MMLGNLISCLAVLTIALTVADGSILMKQDSCLNANNSVDASNDTYLVQYTLYNPNTPSKGCIFKSVSFLLNNCSFNKSLETKFLTHGYQTKLLRGNLFEVIKDKLLEYNTYNVIVVNWTASNQGAYPIAAYNAYLVGKAIARLINCTISKTGLSPRSFHLIGHSLGAHVSGVAGKNVANLGRITGLDPAGPGYTQYVQFYGLASTDANLVDAMHTSNAYYVVGLGEPDPIAKINCYPNGGQSQPMCAYGKNYSDTDGRTYIVRTEVDRATCFHDSSVTYFIASIFDCQYLSTECDDYSSYSKGKCKSHPKNLMGYHCEPMPNFPDNSQFFLNTTGKYPYC